MRKLPSSRGELTDLLLAALTQEVHELPTAPSVDVPAPLDDEDLQLALYLCYELHYRGLPGVDDRWEWEPSLLEQRALLEASFESALRDELGAPDAAAPPEIDIELRRIGDADSGPSLSSYVE